MFVVKTARVLEKEPFGGAFGQLSMVEMDPVGIAKKAHRHPAKPVLTCHSSQPKMASQPASGQLCTGLLHKYWDKQLPCKERLQNTPLITITTKINAKQLMVMAWNNRDCMANCKNQISQAVHEIKAADLPEVAKSLVDWAIGCLFSFRIWFFFPFDWFFFVNNHFSLHMLFFYSWHPASLLSWWLAVFWVDIFQKAGVCLCNWWRNKPTLPTENWNHFDSLLGRKGCDWLLSQGISYLFLWGSILCNDLNLAHHFFPLPPDTERNVPKLWTKMEGGGIPNGSLFNELFSVCCKGKSPWQEMKAMTNDFANVNWNPTGASEFNLL